MEGAEEELERRSKFLSSLIQKKKAAAAHDDDHQQQQIKTPRQPNNNNNNNIRVRASDMPIAMQNKAFMCLSDYLHSTPPESGNEINGNVKIKIDSKRLAFALKKEFDRLYGPAWHCIVGTSFGSYVTHSSGGFLYFSIDKVHVLLFKTTLEPINNYNV